MHSTFDKCIKNHDTYSSHISRQEKLLIVKYYIVLVYLLNTDLALFHMHANILSASPTFKKKKHCYYIFKALFQILIWLY